MKYGVLRYSYSNNIGDEMQSIAAQCFLPRVDVTIERDRLHWYKDNGPITVPFNGWFTRPAFPACWPPPPNLRPLFVSWYAVVPEALINERTAGYFKQYEPIGCRSLPTIKCFEQVGVSAYHSGCLTLTLPESRAERTDDIYIVDADPALVEKVVPVSQSLDTDWTGDFRYRLVRPRFLSEGVEPAGPEHDADARASRTIAGAPSRAAHGDGAGAACGIRARQAGNHRPAALLHAVPRAGNAGGVVKTGSG